MFEHYFGLIEALFVFGLAIAFYIWQMRDLKRENAKAKAKALNGEASTAADPPREAVAEKIDP